MNIRKITIAAAIGAVVFTSAACGSDTPTGGSSAPATTSMSSMTSMTDSSAPMTDSSESMTESMTESSGDSSMTESSGDMTESSSDMTDTSGSMTESSGSMTSGTDDAAANLVGPGCAAYAEANPDGAASVGGMAEAKVAQAASANPLLKTLVSAVSGKLNPKVDLVDTLNDGEFTVFAPVDDAFAKIDSSTIDTLKTDDALLSKILTYHVIKGQLSPSEIVGTHKTVEGQDVTVTGSGDNLKVGDATVICGGVKTANATVYLIDTVLMPPSS